MNTTDFVYNQVYKGALNQGVHESVALQYALIALDKYKKSNIGGVKVSKFIKDTIIQAKKASKGVR